MEGEVIGVFTPELYRTVIAIVDMRMAEIKVTRQDFEELKGAVRELAEALKEAQKETRQEVARL
ncbi:MAG: hypothetical protein HPY58_13455, partial [Firmicutes bacterium]|nr:hypothetical protein [Bacillota bacterium]NPV30624.1 hypothetical protein [Bacillota bacterium]